MIIFFKRLNIIILLIFIFGVIGLFKFTKSIPDKNNLNHENYDAVVVVTGDRGQRIEVGYTLINSTNLKKMFISGMGGSLKVLQNILELDEEIVACCIDVGYKAKNTYQNAIETKLWAKDNNVKSIILITTDIHMLRTLFLFEKITDLKISPYIVKSKDSLIPFEKLISEYFKYLISRLIFINNYEN